MAGAGAAAIVAAMGRYQRAHAGIGAIGRSSAGVGSGFNGYYPSGHWINSPLGSLSNTNQTASQIYPRPDTETSTYARHRWMFYDGSHVFKNIVPIIGRLGAFPWVYELITAPAAAGAAMGGTIWQPGWSIAQALAAGYGDLECTCTGAFSAGAFTVRMHDQAGNYNDFTFTSSTIAGYDATNGGGFVFLDPVGGTDPGSYPASGVINTISSPIKTMPWAYGATQGTVTYPNAILVCRAGTIPLFSQGADYGIQSTVNCGPQSIITMPGDAACIMDITNSGVHDAFDIQSNANDEYFDGFSFTGTMASASVFRYFSSPTGQMQHRFTARNISAPNVYAGTNPTDNASLFTFDDPSGGTNPGVRNYIALKGCSESNRQNLAANSFALFDMYKNQYVVAELCTVTSNYSTAGCMFQKASIQDSTVRCCLVTTGTTGALPATFCQYNDVGTQNNEWCYNVFDASANTSTSPGATLNYSYSAGVPAGTQAFGLAAYYRNTLVNAHFNVNDPDVPVTNGPVSYTNDTVQWGLATQAVYINKAAGTLPANVGPPTGTEAQASSGVVVGGGDYSFQSAYSSWAGLRGAIIE